MFLYVRCIVCPNRPQGGVQKMQGRIIVSDDTQWEWIYVPQAHIYFRTTLTGRKKLFVAAFRSDGYRQIEGGLVSMEWWIEQSHTIVATLEVPEDIVAFAVESERLRQLEVGGVTTLLATAVVRDARINFRDYLGLILEQQEGQTEEEEHEMGLRIQQLMARAGGLH